MVIVAPFDRPQAPAPHLGGVEHPLAPELIKAVRQHGNRPVGLWKIINDLAKARKPGTRDHGRCLCLRYWGAARELLRAKLLFRHNGMVATSDFAFTPKPRSLRRLSPDVGRSARETAVSGSAPTKATTAASGKQIPERQVSSCYKAVLTGTAEVQSAPPSPSQVSAAARTLAKRPRKVKRPWTGFLEGKRIKRGTLVRVPSGEVLPVYVVLRGKVLVALPDQPRYADRVFDRYDASQVERIKHPAAQLLGATKPRPGSRPRGRPRRPQSGAAARKVIPVNHCGLAESLD